MFKTTFSKILISIVFTTSLALFAVSIFTMNSVNKGFRDFLKRQEEEFIVFKGIRNQLFEDFRKNQTHIKLVNEFQRTVNRSITWSSILAFSSAFIIGFIVSGQITKPIEKLKKLVVKVKENNYKYRLEEEGSEEIRSLICEFNQLVDELEEVEKLRENLVSDVAHELKTPITKLRGQLEGIIDGVYKADEKHLEKIVSNIEQLEYLIERLQDMVQIKSGKESLKKEKVFLRNLVDEIVSGYICDEINVRIDISDDLYINADRNKLREILDNLVSNAYKYTEKGVIEIIADSESLIIKDTGIGIAKKDIPYLFERFFRAEKSRNKISGGLGLGLSIVKELVEAHGWTIEVESKEGKGTSFILRF